MATSSKSDLFRRLPSVDEVLRSPELAPAIAREGRALVTEATRSVLEQLRLSIQNEDLDENTLDQSVGGLADAVAKNLSATTDWSLRPIINGTGVILHTNLGRAPLAQTALDHIREASAGYSNLEFDLAKGERGERDVHVDRLFQRLFAADEGAPSREISSIVVNNNAAAVWLALNTLAAGGEVVVSRGELVEIGGSFRIPDVMAQSNGILREVGTTNRTRGRDYANAINDKTRGLLRVHRSNFQITGFTEQPTLKELVDLAAERGIPLVEDLGSGALLDLESLGVRGESGVGDSLRAGVDVVTYSGDKLLGGPQAGILTGRTELIRRMRANSLFRALRVDKLTYAALEATLLAYLKADFDAIPALRMMRLSPDSLALRARAIVKEMERTSGIRCEVIEGESVIGGGAAPSAALPTWLAAIAVDGLGADELLTRLRDSRPPVMGRVQEGRVVLDLRTVFPEQDQVVVAALRAIGE